ncbi:hypothetical protein BKA63DRAFT_567613 [Paraphoma chrysanthemicola]|nr:hypothetical protein BKA63DRAFT_567613 [Paraphoma chrysanthemicola]
MDNITESINTLDIRATGFFDLPGKLRNQIYTRFLQDQSTYAEVAGFVVSHPRIRHEFRSQILSFGRLRPHLNELNTFLDDFYSPSQMLQMHEVRLALCMDIKHYWKEDNTTTDNRPIDIIRLASIFRQCPNLSMTTISKWADARTLRELGIPRMIEVIRSNDNWANPHSYINKLELDRSWKWAGVDSVLWSTERPSLVLRLVLTDWNAAEHELTDPGCACGGTPSALIHDAMEALGLNRRLWLNHLPQYSNIELVMPHPRVAHLLGL